MSPVPPEWRTFAKHKANEILEEVTIGGTLRAPIAINDVIESYVGDVQIVTSMDDLFPEGVSAFSTKDMSVGWLIVINGREPLVRQRFSAAHELAHIALIPNQPKKVYCTHNSTGWAEKLCDRFAGDILMPDALVRKFYDTTPVPRLEDIARAFKVSRQVAEIQLTRLGLPFGGGVPV